MNSVDRVKKICKDRKYQSLNLNANLVFQTVT